MTTKSGKNTSQFTDEERSAMQARASEVRTSSRAKDKAAAEAQACLDAIAEMPDHDKELAARVHELVTSAAPGLAPKTWYGMPAYASDGKVVCYFKAADKFKTRYAQLGFEQEADLDDGSMWPVVWAITELSAAQEREITKIVKKAARAAG
ncbi:DUF1801 domain-containing protein [Nocardioides agariphilus]|uniref:DUF1801 domain-containing protein n=1 Tax=Nocardioides agariphilus TaxID=433664 RepID=A0A930VMG6_9ACTN|nr:DUF1801 domain-containing protein [Nocardioides agariphilus]MBF4769458.1 DUF1801 domain-containing protein [Nocardioides agariphilus]